MQRDERDKAMDDERCRKFLADSFLALSVEEEKEARAALARRIRDQMPVSITRELLALAIDPDATSAIPNMVPTRKFVFENATKGHPSEWRRNAEIKHLIATKYLPEAADKAMAGALKDYQKISNKLPAAKQRQLIEAVERARAGRGVLEAVYKRVAKDHGISRRTVQRIWLGK